MQNLDELLNKLNNFKSTLKSHKFTKETFFKLIQRLKNKTENEIKKLENDTLNINNLNNELEKKIESELKRLEEMKLKKILLEDKKNSIDINSNINEYLQNITEKINKIKKYIEISDLRKTVLSENDHIQGVEIGDIYTNIPLYKDPFFSNEQNNNDITKLKEDLNYNETEKINEIKFQQGLLSVDGNSVLNEIGFFDEESNEIFDKKKFDDILKKKRNKLFNLILKEIRKKRNNADINENEEKRLNEKLDIVLSDEFISKNLFNENEYNKIVEDVVEYVINN